MNEPYKTQLQALNEICKKEARRIFSVALRGELTDGDLLYYQQIERIRIKLEKLLEKLLYAESKDCEDYIELEKLRVQIFEIIV